MWIGRGGAVAAALFFVVLRGVIALLVGPLFGETTPSLPLYLGEALAIELAAVLVARRGPLALGAAGGFLAGTLGFATEWGWTHLAMKLPWEPGILPEAMILAAIAGTAGGLLGALVGCSLRGELPRPAVARPVAALSALALVAVVADGLYDDPAGGARARARQRPAQRRAARRAARPAGRRRRRGLALGHRLAGRQARGRPAAADRRG